MTKTFEQGFDELLERIGPGDLFGSVVVDQVYAHYQHERLDLNHPRGGHAKYLSIPLYADREKMFAEVAATVLEDGGKEGMRRAVEHLSDRVEVEAPLLDGDLRRSGHPSVKEDGHVVSDRPPKQHRLTEEELREKGRRRILPPELLGYIWWHVMHKQHPPNWKGGA